MMLQRIKRYINQRGITNAEFGRRAGVNTDKVWRWLKGKRIMESDIEKVEQFLKKEGY